MNNFRIVLDTNILLISLPTKSKYRPVFDALIDGRFDLVISNEILFEYREIVETKTNSTIANNLSELLISLTNTELIEVYYKWNLIVKDPDDNKFIDAYLAGNANYIVTNDKHFSVLRTLDFPKIYVINIKEFMNLL